ncbi:hypothetical protein CC80DRAFT_434807 [Byssothecium circinans]|uniref:Uncharacterized protein n=1 Tax=Byssothecium circinans TaxID=147558 RepID=A0A6A5UBD7_9PLEO|nr:hypothetical protein CC80DRAFT_434807 [Byssothecium circinans]
MAPLSTNIYESRPHADSNERADFETLSMRSISRGQSPRPSYNSHNDHFSNRTMTNGDYREIGRGNATFWQKFQPFPWRVFSVISSVPIALMPIVVLATAAEEASLSYIMGRDCYPNGMWKEATGATWRIMDSSYFFTPNLSFGAMTFTQVKVIDIAWDLCIGRGGQILLAYVNYRVFNEWLLYHMEIHLTSYKMYTAVAFQTNTLTTLGVLGKEFLAFGKGSWKRFFRWLAMLCMLISTLYVLAFPTLMSAMTGYIATSEAYIEDNDHNLVEFNKAVGVRYIIHDGARIGYNNPVVVTLQDTSLLEAVNNYTSTYADERWPPLTFFQTRIPPAMWNEFLVKRPSTFVWDQKIFPLDEPTLNITLMRDLKRPKPISPGVRYTEPIYPDWYYPETISPGLKYAYYSLSSNSSADSGRQDTYYSSSYVHEHGSCKPSDTYQWGFSYIFLFMMSIFNFVWSCVMVGMWWDTVRGSRMYRAGRRPGLLRSVLDMAKAIREELGDEEVEEMKEEDIKKGLRESGGKLVVPKGEIRIGRTNGDEGPRERKSSWKRSLTKGSTF